MSAFEAIVPNLELTLVRFASLSLGQETNKPVKWIVSKVDAENQSFFFKGKKTEYRIVGKRIYSITGPVRDYKII